MKKYLLIFFLIIGCVSSPKKSVTNISNMKFSDELSLEQFKINLEEYANNNPYPNIDN